MNSTIKQRRPSLYIYICFIHIWICVWRHHFHSIDLPRGGLRWAFGSRIPPSSTNTPRVFCMLQTTMMPWAPSRPIISTTHTPVHILIYTQNFKSSNYFFSIGFFNRKKKFYSMSIFVTTLFQPVDVVGERSNRARAPGRPRTLSHGSFVVLVAVAAATGDATTFPS